MYVSAPGRSLAMSLVDIQAWVGTVAATELHVSAIIIIPQVLLPSFSLVVRGLRCVFSQHVFPPCTRWALGLDRRYDPVHGHRRRVPILGAEVPSLLCMGYSGPSCSPNGLECINLQQYQQHLLECSKLVQQSRVCFFPRECSTGV